FVVPAENADGTVQPGQIWSVQLDGKIYSYTTAAGDTDATVASQIKAAIHSDEIGGDKVTFQNINRLTVLTGGRADNVTLRDTATLTVVDTGAGDDHITVGVVPQVPDRGGAPTTDHPEGVPIVDKHHLTNGVSNVTYIYGGTGDDFFEVNHNAAALWVYG